MLKLYEELLLLGFDDEKGKLIGRASMGMGFGLAGAVFFELHLAEKISLKGKDIVVTDRRALDDDILDSALQEIHKSAKRRTLDYWIGKLPSKYKNLQQRILDRLVDKGILKHEEQRALWIFPVQRYPTDDPRSEMDIRKRIRDIVLHGKKPDLKSVLLLSLVKSCELIPEIFEKDKVKFAKERIEHLTEKEPIGDAIDKAVQAIQAAIAASIATNMIIMTTVTTAGR